MKKLRTLAALLAALGASAADAQEYSRFLACRGNVVADGLTKPAELDLALRVNSRTALIQASNVMPVGEIMRYVPTPANYSMTYLLWPQGVRALVVPGWFSSTVLVAYPNLRRLNQIRLSINRQTGALHGRLLNEEDALLAEFRMQCESQAEEEVRPPKF